MGSLSYDSFSRANKTCIYLTSDRLDNSRQIMVLSLTMLLPRCEVTHFPIITVIGEPHLWTDQDDFAVVNNDTTIVVDVLVNNGPGD